MAEIQLIRKLNITTQNVLYFRADANYTEVVFINGERLMVSKTLKSIEKRFLNDKVMAFFRTHKSYMINLDHVIGYQLNDGMKVHLQNHEEAEISRRRKDAFLACVRKRGFV